jgi:formate/nitrite transporter FocA (FNT family)
VRITYWFRISGPFLVGCFAGLCIALGTIAAVRSGVAAFDGDWGYVSVLAVVAACWLIGGWLVIFNGMELYRT